DNWGVVFCCLCHHNANHGAVPVEVDFRNLRMLGDPGSVCVLNRFHGDERIHVLLDPGKTALRLFVEKSTRYKNEQQSEGSYTNGSEYTLSSSVRFQRTMLGAYKVLPLRFVNFGDRPVESCLATHLSPFPTV